MLKMEFMMFLAKKYLPYDRFLFLSTLYNKTIHKF